MAFEMAEAGDRGARDAILQIIQRDPLPEKRERAQKTWHSWTPADDKADDPFPAKNGPHNATKRGDLPAFTWTGPWHRLGYCGLVSACYVDFLQKPPARLEAADIRRNLSHKLSDGRPPCHVWHHGNFGVQPKRACWW